MAVDLEDAFLAVGRRVLAVMLALGATVVGGVFALVALLDNSGPLAIVALAVTVVIVFCAARLADPRWWGLRALLAIAGFATVLIVAVRETAAIGWPFVPLAVFVAAPYWPRR